jgi:hypothetical protein
MVPMVAGTDQLVGHLLLLGRQAGVERLECSKKTGVVVTPHFRELLSQLEALDRSMLARISQRGRCIGTLDLRKSFCESGLSQGPGKPDADGV